jgi:Tol biopolymer transport system component
MRGIIGTLTLVAAFVMSVAGAQATIMYTKGQKIYTASNSGKGAKQVATGDAPMLSQDGQFVIYSNSTDALLKVPVGGGTTTSFGGTDKWCGKCSVIPSPDGKSVLLNTENSDLDFVPIDGSAPVRLGTSVYTWGMYSPDSKQVVFDQGTADSDTVTIFTTPVTGGVPTKLNLGFGTEPVWTTAGIVASTVSFTGKKTQFKIVLLDPLGNVKQVLQRSTLTSKALKTGIGIQDVFMAAGANVVTLALAKKSKSILRLVSASNGKVKSKLTFGKNEFPAAVDPTGKTVLGLTKKGKLFSVNFKSGKRKTLVKHGVGFSVDIAR